jgi:ketosteroid isomerase-like protein
MRRVLAVLAGLALAVLAQPGLAEEAEIEAEAVKATLVDMWDAIEKGDLERYASYIHPDYTSFGESDVYLSVGKKQELRGIAAYLKRARNVHTEMHQPKVTIRGDTAWIVYYWSDSGEIDGKRFRSRGKSTRIFVKESGRWLCIHGHFTAVP